MGTGNILQGEGKEPCNGLTSCPGGVAILLGMLHTKESGISSGRLGLWLLCIFTLDWEARLG